MQEAMTLNIYIQNCITQIMQATIEINKHSEYVKVSGPESIDFETFVDSDMNVLESGSTKISFSIPLTHYWSPKNGAK